MSPSAVTLVPAGINILSSCASEIWQRTVVDALLAGSLFVSRNNSARLSRYSPFAYLGTFIFAVSFMITRCCTTIAAHHAIKSRSGEAGYSVLFVISSNFFIISDSIVSVSVSKKSTSLYSSFIFFHLL